MPAQVQGERVTDLMLAGQLREREPTLSLSSAAGLATFEASTWKHGATRQHVHELSDAMLAVKACQVRLGRQRASAAGVWCAPLRCRRVRGSHHTLRAPLTERR